MGQLTILHYTPAQMCHSLSFATEVAKLARRKKAHGELMES